MDAMRDDIITSNPVSLVKIPKVEKVDIYPFSEDEIFTIIENAEGQYKNFYALAFFSGMRSSEMIGLRWSDLNFTREEINISQGIRMGEDILWVSHMLGHTDATMTLSKYARYIKRDNKIRGAFLQKSVALIWHY